MEISSRVQNIFNTIDTDKNGVSAKELKNLTGKDGKLSIEEAEKQGVDLTVLAPKDIEDLNKIVAAEHEPAEILFPSPKGKPAEEDDFEPADFEEEKKLSTNLDANENNVSLEVGYTLPITGKLSLTAKGSLGLDKSGGNWQPGAGLSMEANYSFSVKKIEFTTTGYAGISGTLDGNFTPNTGLRVNAEIPLNQKLSFSTTGSIGLERDDQQFKPTFEAGAGVGYKVNEHVTLNTNIGYSNEGMTARAGVSISF